MSFKLQPLRGLGFVPLSLSSFVLEPLLVENNPPVSTGARTPPSNWDCTMTIASERLLFLDGDHLGKQDCMMRMTKAILSKRMSILDGDHHSLLALLLTTPLHGLAPRTDWFLAEIRPCCSFLYLDLDEQS